MPSMLNEAYWKGKKWNLMTISKFGATVWCAVYLSMQNPLNPKTKGKSKPRNAPSTIQKCTPDRCWFVEIRHFSLDRERLLALVHMSLPIYSIVEATEVDVVQRSVYRVRKCSNDDAILTKQPWASTIKRTGWLPTTEHAISRNRVSSVGWLLVDDVVVQACPTFFGRGPLVKLHTSRRARNKNSLIIHFFIFSEHG